ncbi:Dolichol-phosphate mannosyltransferase-like protein [Arachis hypogaea]|uniref:Dolichol-phosphate mannosyltransferase subunit 3 n=1 Tax=Arachis hypogaea TaxID=3818 RepID=A0A445CV68_ARAHY|nr:Dolichol-phosphate mannosyltransferase-like protein [Arachis hypogaea]RYR54803.1 hypothetical protein Ahy_A06g030074 isoform C [Arachis hypogaea]
MATKQQLPDGDVSKLDQQFQRWWIHGCYGLLMVGVGLMNFPTCPQEALLLQEDIVEAKEYLKQRGVDVSSS